MRVKLLFISIVAFQLISCISLKGQKTQKGDLTGTYILKSGKLYQERNASSKS